MDVPEADDQLDEDLDADVARVEAQIRSTLGEPSTWPSPVMLPSVVQCVLNSIYSTGNRSETVVKILDTYRERRRAAGADPDEDGPDELLAEIRSCGGPEGFAGVVGNYTRAWQRKTAPYKGPGYSRRRAPTANGVHPRS